MPSGRYRVTINGFRCNTETWDDALNWDGKHDEVFISTSVKYADRNGQILFQTQTQSPTMGDTLNQPNRIQAGTASRRGGIITGDSFPSVSPWERSVPLSPARDYPPMTVWEGELTKGEQVVFITPTIWEWDPGQSMWEGWVRWHQQTDAKFGEKAKEIATKVWPQIGWIFDAVSLGIQTASTLFDMGGPLGSSGSRPIGFQQDLSKDPNGKAFSFNPWVIALNYDLAEVLITQQPIGLGNGVLGVTYAEHPYFRGDYTQYLQVERISAPPDHVPSVLQTVNGNYLTAVNGGGRTTDVLHTDATAIGPWEKFTLVDLGGNQYALKTVNGNYLTAVNGGGRTTDVLHTDATAIGPWEKFTLVDLGGNQYALKTVNGNYLTAVNGGGRTTDVLHTDATAIGPWEKFTIKPAA